MKLTKKTMAAIAEFNGINDGHRYILFENETVDVHIPLIPGDHVFLDIIKTKKMIQATADKVVVTLWRQHPEKDSHEVLRVNEVLDKQVVKHGKRLFKTVIDFSTDLCKFKLIHTTI